MLTTSCNLSATTRSYTCSAKPSASTSTVLLPCNRTQRCMMLESIVCRTALDDRVDGQPSETKPKRTRRKKSDGSASSTQASEVVVPSTAASAIQQKAQAPSFTLDEEFALQEQEVDVTVDDLVSMQYEVPSEEFLEQEMNDIMEMEGLDYKNTNASSDSQQAKAQAEEQLDVSAQTSRKSAILLELIAAAAGSDLDAKIAQFIEDIDDELLQLLVMRIDVISKVDVRAADLLRDLEAVLRVVHNRANASPALRLLDDVLDMLGEDMTDAQAYSSKRLEAMSRLREAFSGGAKSGVDIFAAAAALADAGPLAAAELAAESVSAQDFIAETTRLLDDTRQAQNQLAGDISRAEKEIKYLQKTSPEVLKTAKAAAHLQQLDQARRVHAGRATALAQLQDVLGLARMVANEQTSQSQRAFDDFF